MRKHIFTGEGHYHYVTFSCLGRRRLLAAPRARQIVISVLGTLAQRDRVRVAGFVIMPDHVHAVLWFKADQDLPGVMQTWKRLSAHYLKQLYEETRPDLLKYLVLHVSVWIGFRNAPRIFRKKYSRSRKPNATLLITLILLFTPSMNPVWRG